MLADIVHDVFHYVASQRSDYTYTPRFSNHPRNETLEYVLHGLFMLKRDGENVSLSFSGGILGHLSGSASRERLNITAYMGSRRTVAVVQSILNYAKELTEGTYYNLEADEREGKLKLEITGTEESLREEIKRLRELFGLPRIEEYPIKNI